MLLFVGIQISTALFTLCLVSQSVTYGIFCLPDVLSEKRFRSWNSDKKQVVNYTEVINVVSFLLGDICSHK